MWSIFHPRGCFHMPWVTSGHGNNRSAIHRRGYQVLSALRFRSVIARVPLLPVRSNSEWDEPKYVRIVRKRLWVRKPANSGVTRTTMVDFLVMWQVGLTCGESKDCCVVWWDDLQSNRNTLLYRYSPAGKHGFTSPEEKIFMKLCVKKNNFEI